MINAQKYNKEKAEKYWLTIHQKEIDDLKAVCFPGHSYYLNTFFDKMQKFAINRAVTYLKIPIKNKNILDIGCGRGRWLEFYSKLGGIVTGVDLSQEAVNICRQKGFNVRQGNILHLPFENGVFDVVNSVTVLHHISFDDQKLAIDEISRVLKPQGIVIILECTYNDPAPHMYGRTIESWKELFHNCHMVFSEAHYYSPLIRLFWKIPIMRKIKYLENIIVFIQFPLEKKFLEKNFCKINDKALQHLMIFQKE